MESKFGWLLLGPIHNENIHRNGLNTLWQRIEILPVEESKLENLLKKWLDVQVFSDKDYKP